MAVYKVLYWHDIPSQVRAEDEDGRVGKRLPERFQLAIDDAAMAAKLIDSDGYSDGFHWGEEKERAGSAEQVAAQIVKEFDEKYPQVNWKATAEKIKTNSDSPEQRPSE